MTLVAEFIAPPVVTLNRYERRDLLTTLRMARTLLIQIDQTKLLPARDCAIVAARLELAERWLGDA